MLLIAAMTIKASSGQGVAYRAILDTRSQINIVTTKLVTCLGISINPAIIEIEGLRKSKGSSQHAINVDL